MGKQKLTDEQVREIRHLYQDDPDKHALAEAYDVSASYVRQLARGVRRADAGGPTPEAAIRDAWAQVQGEEATHE